MEFELKTGSQGHIYLPKRFREVFGKTLKLLPNSNAAIVYAENARVSDVVRSVEILLQDLELRAEHEEQITA